MEILHYCPAGVATGGTESIHKLVSEFNKIEGVHARILYRGHNVTNPQPKEYEKYGCEYITEGMDEYPALPDGFKGVVIFPEIWANKVVDPLYKNCVTAVNWAGVDVYDWNVPEQDRGLFLNNQATIHLSQLDYAVDHLKKLGVSEIYRISDVLNDDFFEPYTEEPRGNSILYNPCPAKMTPFTAMVIQRCNTEMGLKFQPLEGYTREQLIYLMRHSKLYVDFGVFSGRERLPREAAICGCCVITSKMGAAWYHSDLAIPDKYKFYIDQVDEAMRMIKATLYNYKNCVEDFKEYRESLIADRENLPEQCKIVVRRFKELCQDSV